MSHQDLLEATRAASVHLSLPSTSVESAGAALPSSSDAVLVAASPTAISDKALDAILALSSKFENQSQLAMQNFDEQQAQINAINQ